MQRKEESRVLRNENAVLRMGGLEMFVGLGKRRKKAGTSLKENGGL